MEEQTLILPSVTEDEIKNTLMELIAPNKMPQKEKISMIVGFKKMKFALLRSLNPVVSQICDCLLIGAHVAAMTLTNFFVERTLKLAIILKEGNGKTYNGEIPLDQLFKEEIDKYDEKEMGQTINKAKSLGVITKQESKFLEECRKKYRNPFSHAECLAIFNGVKTKIYETSLTNPTEMKESTVDLSYTPLFQEWGLPQYCKKHAFNYFIEIFALAHQIEERLRELYPKTKDFQK